MTYSHIKNSPHGELVLVDVQSPSAWKGLFNAPAAMAGAVKYVYYRPTTREIVVQNQKGQTIHAYVLKDDDDN